MLIQHRFNIHDYKLFGYCSSHQSLGGVSLAFSLDKAFLPDYLDFPAFRCCLTYKEVSCTKMSNRSCCSESSGGPPTTSLSTISSKRSFQEDPESQGLDAKRPRTEPFAYNSGETSNRDYQTNFGQDITVTDQASFRIGNDYHQTFLGSTQEDTKQALDHKKGVIVSWLSKSLPDVSKYHISACQKHEETTGSWLIQSDMLKSWMETGNSFLWLNAGGKLGYCSI